MLRTLSIATFCAALLCAPALAQTLPNPIVVVSPAPSNLVKIVNGKEQPVSVHPSTPYTVTCLSSSSAKGTWRQITTSTYISQQALKYNPTDAPQQIDLFTASVLYCIGSDGKPGTIQGAPASLILAVGSTFDVVPLATVILPSTLPNLPVHRTAGVPFDPAIALRSGPAGVAVISSHDMVVYPPGSRLFVGGGLTFEYLKPGQASGIFHRQQLPTNSDNGCTVSFANDTGKINRTERYDRDCDAIDLAKRWSAVIDVPSAPVL